MTDPKLPSPDMNSGSGFNRILSILALVISIIAMLVSILEVFELRRSETAAVWPYISIGESYNEQGFAIRLENKGVGPALIGDFGLYLDGELMDDLDQMIIDVNGADQAFSYDVYGSTVPQRTVIAPGESANLFSVPWEQRTRNFVNAGASRIDIRTCYCSIHGDCWSVSFKGNGPVPTDRCEGASRH